MRFKYIIIFTLLANFASAQQDFTTFLQSVEQNNKKLKAAESYQYAKKLEAKSGIYLNNPEISYDFLAATNENYSEMVVSQSFDFPTTYIHKKKISNLSVKQTEELIRQIRLETFSEAARKYAQKVLLSQRLILASEINGMIKELSVNAGKELQVGQISALEAGRIKAEEAKYNAGLKMLLNDNTAISNEIILLNGGENIEINDTIRPVLLENINADTLLDQILSEYPQKDFWLNEIEKSKNEVKLQKSNSLPKFEIGYRQDMSSARIYNGLHAGVSIPLFENKNTIRQARARQVYTEEESLNYFLAYKTSLENKFTEINSLKESVAETEKVVNLLNTRSLLLKAYHGGQISYSEFFAELNNFIELENFLLDLRGRLFSLELELYVLLNY